MGAEKKTSGTLRTGALVLILGCFAASGMLRFSEAIQSADMSDVSGRVASLFDGKAAKATEDAKLREMAAQVAADEAAIVAGAIATASTKKDEQGAGGVEMDEAGMAKGDQGDAIDAPLGPRLGGSTGAVDEAAKLLQALRKREADLDSFSDRLNKRKLELDAAAKRVAERIEELERSKEEFAALVASVDQASERDVEHLVEMYSKMKPKEAGQLFNAMAPSFAAGFLGRMRADKASAIMSKMDTKKAYVVSLELAGRNVQQRPAEAGARQ